MGAAHGHRLYFHGHSPVHRLPAHCKIVALLCFVLAVVATPAGVFWPFAWYAVGLLAAVGASRVPPLFLARRMVVETPFVLFAVLMPFVATGPRVDLLGVSVSEHGLQAAAMLLCKGTLGVVASLLFAATTESRDFLAGLQRLRMPQQLVQIMAFMVRYLDVTTAEMQRMRVAREARCFSARGPAAWPTVARSGGALFIRAYERGERVHLAMLSRGYAGRLPMLSESPASALQWSVAALLPGFTVLVSLAAWTISR
ncbi:MAG: cobalt ECF transporter T component CbiQ [Propionibacteriales bacterium]|nr:cobalt ECF transporter T component CbiQ [Propionibacteriales bacterium]